MGTVVPIACDELHSPTMTLFTNSSIKRRIASVMLVFWLFALGSAWANACVLQERGTHSHPDATAHAGTHSVSAGHVGVLDDHGASSSPGKAPCLKVCDDSSQSLVKWQSGIDLLNLAIAPPAAMTWSAPVDAFVAPRPAKTERFAHAERPLRTRFSRLTL